MNKPLTLNVRIGGAPSDFVSANVGDDGSYENVSASRIPSCEVGIVCACSG